MRKGYIFVFFIILAIFSLLLHSAEYHQYKPSPRVAKYFNKEECSIVLNKFYYLNCYSYDYKSSKVVAYELDKQNLIGDYIKKRPPFKPDNALKKEYRTYPSNYTNTGYDRGHIIPNASMRATKEAQESTFLMSNITPQKPIVNRRVWKDIETRERDLAIKEGRLEVLNIIAFDDHPNYIKDIAIPMGYIKVLIAKNIQECYYVPNIDIKDLNYEHYKIDCEQIP